MNGECSSRETRRRNQYNPSLLYDAVKCVLRGKMNCHQAAIRFKIPRSTVQRKLNVCREQHRRALEYSLRHEAPTSSSNTRIEATADCNDCGVLNSSAELMDCFGDPVVVSQEVVIYEKFDSGKELLRYSLRDTRCLGDERTAETNSPPQDEKCFTNRIAACALLNTNSDTRAVDKCFVSNRSEVDYHENFPSPENSLDITRALPVEPIDGEQEEIEKAADRLSEAFKSVPSKSKLHRIDFARNWSCNTKQVPPERLKRSADVTEGVHCSRVYQHPSGLSKDYDTLIKQ